MYAAEAIGAVRREVDAGPSPRCLRKSRLAVRLHETVLYERQETPAPCSVVQRTSLTDIGSAYDSHLSKGDSWPRGPAFHNQTPYAAPRTDPEWVGFAHQARTP